MSQLDYNSIKMLRLIKKGRGYTKWQDLSNAGFRAFHVEALEQKGYISEDGQHRWSITEAGRKAIA